MSDGEFVDETPVPDLVDGKARDLDRALLAQDRERAFEIGRARRGGRLDDAERAVAEFQRRDRGVLGLDLRQRRDRAGMNADDVAEEPFQHVDVVAGLVGQHAAVIGPGAAPGVLVVIGLVAAPAHPHRAENEPAEAAGVQRLARLHHRNVEAVLLDDEQLDAGFVAGADHVVGILQPQRHRLLDDDMLAGLRAGDDMLRDASRSASARRPRRYPCARESRRCRNAPARRTSTAIASARARTGSQTATSLAPSMWLPPSRSEWRLAIRPHPSRPNLIMGSLVHYSVRIRR